MFRNKDAQATVPVKSLDRARPFYEQVLGLEPLPAEQPGVQGYKAGGSTVLVYESAFAGTNKATTVTWPLGASFDEVVKALRAKGVAFLHYDGMPGVILQGDVHVAGDMRVAWFQDPDGNIINIGNY
jgi:catechol 2,3-dioxygenase-like lactoylglutathione lyase family enzyme